MPIPRSPSGAAPPSPRSRLPVGARRAALLEHLRATGEPTTVGDLAEAVGLHANTVRAHLDLLVRDGHVERSTEVRATRGRPRELYRALAPTTDDDGYALLASVLAAQLEAVAGDPAAQGVEAGRRWSRSRAADDADDADDDAATRAAGSPSGDDADGTGRAVGRVLGVLARSGFAPELTADGRRILLHDCPFRDVARAHTAIVCSAHLGLIQGTLDRAGAPVTATRLVPFVEPRLCVAELEVGPGTR
ncbi:MarR family transcriptional regulator [Actinotalea sp. AC32]|nr:MarR family transcriptional regulator [Actinotalea sp. AC32]